MSSPTGPRFAPLLFTLRLADTERTHHFLCRSLGRSFCFIADTLATNCERVCMQQSRFVEPFRDDPGATRTIQISSHEPPAGFQIGQQRHSFRDLIKVIQREAHPSLVSNRQQM